MPQSRWIWYAVVAIVIATVVEIIVTPAANRLAYSEVKAAVARDEITEVAISPTTLSGRTKDGKSFETVRVDDPGLLYLLAAHNVKISGARDSSIWTGIALWIIPLVVLAFLLSARQMGGGKGTLMAVGRSKPKLFLEKDVKVSFADVAGVDEAKEELREVILFLNEPKRYTAIGAKLPRGVLLVGPPGTGKTLLARAVAGEAHVPFFSISGSEFVEMFVGVGAARVRDLFVQAREHAPCIVFIDELDALGKVRAVGPMAHDERDQTLNQLLVELDGFDPRVGIVLMAATNRPEILDPALLRAGRFDRHVLVDRPDRSGRKAILEVHGRAVPLAADVDLDAIAAMTPGLVGADLANVINEASLLTVRRGKDKVSQAELTEAIERLVAGLEKKSRILKRSEKERIAHHEVGHALVAITVPSADPVQKISIIPRGIAALGYTLQRPAEDRFIATRSELEDKIAVLLGGRVAEELIYGEPSTGAQDDLLKATSIARSMVRSYGMSEAVGSLCYDATQRPSYLAELMPDKGDYGEEVEKTIDAETRRIVEEQHDRVTALLGGRAEALRRAAAELLERETLSGEELRAVVG